MAKEKATVSKDGLKYTYELKDAKWDNGTPVTAKDFVYAWQRTVSNPDAEYNYLYGEGGACVANADDIVAGKKKASDLGVKAVNDTTLEITLSKPCAYFESLMSFPVFYPINQEFAEEKGDQFALTPENMLACGAFKMTSWETGSKYVLEKNPGILFVVDRTKAIGGDDSKDNVAANELIQKTDAGKMIKSLCFNQMFGI